MSKKVEKTIDDKEDQEIRNIAYFNNSSQVVLLIVLIILFGFTFFCTLTYIGDYYKNKNDLNNNSEIININTNKSNATIINNSKIYKKISEQDINKDENIVLENKSEIEFSTNKNSLTDGVVYFDVKYNITKNDFTYHAVATNKSDVLVKFYYSYDGKEWQSIKNVISVNDSTLSPLMGGYYDIAGLRGTLRVSTNNSLTSKPKESTKMYWKCETYIVNNEENLGKELAAEFKIEYKDND